MKSVIAILLTLVLLLSFAGCTDPNAGCAIPADSGTSDSSGSAVFAGKVLWRTEEQLLLGARRDAANDVGELYVCPAVLVRTSDSCPAGALVEVDYSGYVLETFPAFFGNPTEVRTVGEEDDLVGLYLAAFDEMLRVKGGGDADVELLAFDLSETNLSLSERTALLWAIEQKTGVTAITSDFDTLRAEGQINSDNIFSRGLFCTFSCSDVTDDSFSFSLTAYRGPLSAVFLSDCKARRTGSTWQFTVGAFAVS